MEIEFAQLFQTTLKNPLLMIDKKSKDFEAGVSKIKIYL